jgi:hypothetical protein
MTPAGYDITLSKEQLQVIGAALGKRPYVEVVHLIAHIEQQIDAADRAAAQAAQDAQLIHQQMQGG